MKWATGIILVALFSGIVTGQQPRRRKVLRPRKPQNLTSTPVPEVVPAADESQGDGIRLDVVDQNTLPLRSPQVSDASSIGGFGLRNNQDSALERLPNNDQNRQLQQEEQRPLIPNPVVIQQTPQAQLQQNSVAALPTLPVGHQYVDIYGRPLVLAQDPTNTVVQSIPHAPQQTPVQLVNTSVQQPQILVDQYGRQFIEINHQGHAVSQIFQQQGKNSLAGVAQVISPATVIAHPPPAVATAPAVITHAPSSAVVAHPSQVLTHAHPVSHGHAAVVAHRPPVLAQHALVTETHVPTVLQHEIHPAVVHHAPPTLVHKEVHPAVLHHAPPTLVHKEVHHGVPVVQQVQEPVALLQKGPSPVTLQTYAVPSVHKVGNLLIPYAAKFTLAPGKSLHEALNAAILTKSKQKAPLPPGTVISADLPVSVLAKELEVAATDAVKKQLRQSSIAKEQVQQATLQHPQIAIEGHQIAVGAHAAAIPVVPHVPVVETHHLAPTHIKELKTIPDYTVIHQPVLSKPLFQKHIFNVKHGHEPTLFQDLCTVYPYQKNIPACVLKKALLPELHHPDIRTVNVQDATTPVPSDPSIGAGSNIVPPYQRSRQRQSVQEMNPPTTMVVQIGNLAPPENIQAVIQTAKTNAAAMAAATASTVSAPTKQPEPAESRQPSSSDDCSGTKKKRKCSTKPMETDDGGFREV